MAGVAVRQGHHRRSLLCGTLGQTQDARQARIGTDLLHLYHQGLVEIERTSNHQAAGLFRYRTAFPAEQGLVLTALTLHHHAIGRYPLTGSDQHIGTRTQTARQHPPRRSALGPMCQKLRAVRLGRGQRLDMPAGPLPRQQLQPARRQQQEHEHADGIKPDIALGPQRGPEAGKERHQDANADRHIHANAPQPQIAPGRTQERTGREQHHRQGEHQTDDAHQLHDVGCHVGSRVGQIHRQAQHHHLHHGKPRHEQTPQHGAALTQTALLGATGVEGQGTVANGGNRLQHLRQPQLRRVPAQLRTMRDMVDRERLHPAQSCHMLLVQPDAGAAMDALEDQAGLTQPVAQLALMRDEVLLQLFIVVDRPAAVIGAHPTTGIRRGGRSVIALAPLVVVLQSALEDGARHRHAAGAAETAPLPGMLQAPRLRRQVQSAVKTVLLVTLHDGILPRDRGMALTWINHPCAASTSCHCARVTMPVRRAYGTHHQPPLSASPVRPGLGGACRRQRPCWQPGSLCS